MDALSDVLKPRPARLGVQGRKRATDLRVAHAGELSVARLATLLA